MNGSRITFLVSAILCVVVLGAYLAYSSTQSDPTTQFKDIAAAKYSPLKDFLAPRGSELIEYWSEVAEQRRVAIKDEYPYVGRISFEYYETEKAPSRTLQTMTAIYWFAVKRKQWEYKGYELKSSPTDESKTVVQYRDLDSFFKNRTRF